MSQVEAESKHRNLRRRGTRAPAVPRRDLRRGRARSSPTVRLATSSAEAPAPSCIAADCAAGSGCRRADDHRSHRPEERADHQHATIHEPAGPTVTRGEHSDPAIPSARARTTLGGWRRRASTDSSAMSKSGIAVMNSAASTEVTRCLPTRGDRGSREERDPATPVVSHWPCAGRTSVPRQASQAKSSDAPAAQRRPIVMSGDVGDGVADREEVAAHIREIVAKAATNRERCETIMARLPRTGRRVKCRTRLSRATRNRTSSG